jgi:hypothetical protein
MRAILARNGQGALALDGLNGLGSLKSFSYLSKFGARKAGGAKWNFGGRRKKERCRPYLFPVENREMLR